LLAASLDFAVLLIMYKRLLHRRYPALFAYLIFQVAVTHVTLAAVFAFVRPAYFAAYWIAQFAFIVFFALGSFEFLRLRFASYKHVLVLALAIAAIWSALHPAGGYIWYMAAIRGAQRALWIIVALSSLWLLVDRPALITQRDYFIGSGWIAFSWAELLRTELISSFPSLRSAGVVSYVVMISGWMYAVTFAKVPERKPIQRATIAAATKRLAVGVD
jgi:hypothetical protein